MIVIKLWGGFGNQLFQYAFGFVLSKIKDDSLSFDTSFYENQPKYVGKRAYIDQSKFPKIILNNHFKRNSLINLIESRYISHVIRHKTGLKLSAFHYYIFVEKLYKYFYEIPYKKNKINYYDGYWQSAKYFEQYRDEILDLFTPDHEIQQAANDWRDNLNSDCCIAVHIRRGDYIRKGNKSFTQDIYYYKKAIEYFNKRYKNALFCVFSDDIEWCRKQLSYLENVVYVENRVENGDIIDLFSIALCNHGIMSISTFSWWGNWLRKDNSNSLVIYPKGKYFNDHFMPDEWMCITDLVED